MPLSAPMSDAVRPLDARVCIVGPLPPPTGGMANQCKQLLRLMGTESGVRVELVRTNAPYSPRWTSRVPLLRAGARLIPFLWRLWATCGRVDVSS